jgi:CRISPR/Cas system-associated protein Cas7 (RAMP superfamily)
MKTKLTLSLPEKTILEAKQIAKRRNTSVSALFEQSLAFWKQTSRQQESLPGEMTDLLGVFTPEPPFDERSARIRRKHG